MAASMCSKSVQTFKHLTFRNTTGDSLTWLQVRNKHKVNIQKPWPGSIERQIMVAITKPIIPKLKEDPALTCTRRATLPDRLETLTPYEEFLLQHQRSVIEENADGCMLFCFQTSCGAKAYRKNQVILAKEKYKIHRVNRKIFYHAVRDTKYKNVMELMGFSTVLITHPQPEVKSLLTLLKKIPELHLLGGIVDGRLMSKTNIEEYSQLPDKDVLLGQLCALLNQPAARLSQLLTSQQEQLVRNLESYSSGKSEQ